MQIDVFNGDADGICALVQLRLANPLESKLVTGVKRDIDLLRQVQVVNGDFVTVLDISMKRNRSELNRILEQGARVFYVDHHQSGDIPTHPALEAIIETNSNVCTSLLVNQYLNGLHQEWAITAAFGDSLDESAWQLASQLNISETQIKQLKNLGICINYNSYGSSPEELYFKPYLLYQELLGHRSPFDFIHDKGSVYQKLLDGYVSDMDNASKVFPEFANATTAVYVFPDKPWARRASGVFSNALARKHPGRAHAVLTHNKQGGYLVSVRSSLTKQSRADTFCSLFETGGGRKNAAGIDHLPQEQLPNFIQLFAKTFL